jgi:hypothetical protein
MVVSPYDSDRHRSGYRGCQRDAASVRVVPDVDLPHPVFVDEGEVGGFAVDHGAGAGAYVREEPEVFETDVNRSSRTVVSAEAERVLDDFTLADGLIAVEGIDSRVILGRNTVSVLLQAVIDSV